MHKPEVTIITLLWNHCNDLTKPFIADILENTKEVDFNLILVNNNSSDGTKEFIESINDSRVSIVNSTINLGFNNGNNAALKAGFPLADYILFLNNDIKVTDTHWLRTLLDQKDEHSLIGAQLATDNSLTIFLHKMREYVVGWCLLVPKTFLEKHGGFASEFGLGYFEDVELCQRAVSNGYTLKEVSVGITHLGSRSSKDQLDISEQTRFNQIVYKNLMYQHLKGSEKKRIVFFCPGMYPFNDESYEGKGVGGAEASLILLTRELAKIGHIIEVFNDTEVEGSFNGVNYYNLKNYEYDVYADVFVLFRNSMMGLDRVSAGSKIFWSCDQRTTNDWDLEIFPFIDEMFTISKYHREYIVKNYNFNPKKIHVLDLGINGADYEKQVAKQAGKVLYCSVPGRGLEYLFPILQLVKQQVPQLQLYITSDYTLWGSTPSNAEYKHLFESLPWVHFLGKVGREELVVHQKTSELMVYPCNYDENFCISAMECIAAGAVPVTSSIGALTTTVAESGILLSGLPNEQGYQVEFAQEVVHLLLDQAKLKAIRREGQKRAISRYNWGQVAINQWLPTLEAIMKDQKHTYSMSICSVCGVKLANGFELFKHRSEKHPIESRNPNKLIEGQVREKVMVLIKTTRPVELSFNSDLNFTGVKELRVPQESASDVIRILQEAYGAGIIQY